MRKTDLGIDPGAAFLGTAPPPRHHPLELPVTHQRAPRVSLGEEHIKIQSRGNPMREPS